MVNNAHIRTEDLQLWFGKKKILKNITMPIYDKKITALIGPSGCGKSTLLRCFNRMNDLSTDVKIAGKVYLNEKDIYDQNVDITGIRAKVGMVFQKPNPFPKSIYKNVAYGLKLQGKSKNEIEERVYEALRDAGIWDEVKDRLNANAFSLSGGQQQRLCIARALADRKSVV